MNSKKDLDVSLQEMQNRLEGKIKMEFEVDRMEPLFSSEADYKEFAERHANIRFRLRIWTPIQARPSLGLMPAPPPPRPPW